MKKKIKNLSVEISRLEKKKQDASHYIHNLNILLYDKKIDEATYWLTLKKFLNSKTKSDYFQELNQDIKIKRQELRSLSAKHTFFDEHHGSLFFVALLLLLVFISGLSSTLSPTGFVISNQNQNNIFIPNLEFENTFDLNISNYTNISTNFTLNPMPQVRLKQNNEILTFISSGIKGTYESYLTYTINDQELTTNTFNITIFTQDDIQEKTITNTNPEISYDKPNKWEQIIEVKNKKTKSTNQKVSFDIHPTAENLEIIETNRNGEPVLDIVNYKFSDIKENTLEYTFEETLQRSEKKYYKITYETAPPIKEEKIINKHKKTVTISSPTHYLNVPAETTLDNVKKESIHLYWIKDGIKEEFPKSNITYIDTDNDDRINKIKWIVPHLSNQTFEIEIRVLNIKSEPAVGNNWTVFFETEGIANISFHAINTTTYEEMFFNRPGTRNDLEIVKLKCGNNVLFDKNYQIYNDNVFFLDQNNNTIPAENASDGAFIITGLLYENFTCDNKTAEWLVNVKTTGAHYQMIDFGGQYAYAQNNALKPWRVYSGTALFTAEANLSTNNVSIGGTVDRNSSFLLFRITGNETPGADAAEFSMTGNITNSTHIVFKREYCDSTCSRVNITWHVIEGPIDVQHGSASYSGLDANVQVDIDHAVDRNKSMIIVNSKFDQHSNAFRFFLGRGEWINDSRINLTASGSPGVGQIELNYQIVNFLSSDAAVHYGKTTMTTGVETSVVVNTTGTYDVNRSWLYFTYQSDGTSMESRSIKGNIMNSSFINFSKSGNSGNNQIRWFVVEFPDGVNVQRGSFDMTDTNQVQNNINFTQVNLNKAFPYVTWDSAGGGQGTGRNYWVYEFDGNTSIQLSRNRTGQTQDMEWQIINFTGNPTSILWKPVDQVNYSVGNFTIDCNGTDDYGLHEIILYHNFSGTWERNESVSVTGTNDNATYYFTNIPDNLYTWNCLINDSDGNTDFDINRTINVTGDLSSPNITWENPTPADSSTIYQNYAFLNTTIVDEENYSGLLDWNQTLKVYYNFEYIQNTGITGIFDNSTHNNFGNHNSFVMRIPGVYGNGLMMNGTNSRIEINDSNLEDITRGDFSVMMWVKRNESDSTDVVMSQRDGSGTGRSWLVLHQGACGSNLGSALSGITTCTSVDIQPEVWYHIALVYDGSNITIYVNGSKEISAARSPDESADGNLTIGSSKAYTNVFNGTIDEVAIYTRAITWEEINHSFDPINNRLQANITDLSYQSYNFSALAIDSNGNDDKTTLRTITTARCTGNDPVDGQAWTLTANATCNTQSINVTSVTIPENLTLYLNNTDLTVNGFFNVTGNFTFENSKSTLWINDNLSITGNFTLKTATMRINATANGSIGVNVTDGGIFNSTQDSNITNGEDADAYYFFEVWGSSRFGMEDSNFEKAGWTTTGVKTGLVMYNSDTFIVNSSFRDNFYNVDFRSANNSYIYNNSFYDTRALVGVSGNLYGARCGNMTLRNNTIYDNSSVSFSFCDNVVIDKNKLKNIDGVSQSINIIDIDNLTITNNNATSSSTVLRMNSVDNSSVQNNIFTTNTTIGSAAALVVSDTFTKLNNNLFKNNYWNATATDAYAIANVGNNYVHINDQFYSGDGAGLDDIYIGDTNDVGDLILLNSTFDIDDISFGASSAIKLHRDWYFYVRVNDTEDDPIINTNITVYNLSSAQEFNALSSSTGLSPLWNLTEYYRNRTDWINFTNYTFNATLSGYQPHIISYELNSYDIINLTLNKYPGVTLNSPNNGTNLLNSWSILNWTVSDPENTVSEVKVFASNDTSRLYESMVFFLSLSIPLNTSDTLNFTKPVIYHDENTVLLFRFDNNSDFGEENGVYYDFSGEGNNGSCSSNCPVQTVDESLFGKTALFASHTDLINISHSSNLSFTQDDAITIEFWINSFDLPAATNATVLAKGNDTQDLEYTLDLISMDNSGSAFYVEFRFQNDSNNSYRTNSEVIQFNVDTHIAFSYISGNANSARFIINGSTIEAGTWTGNGNQNLTPNTGNLYIGQMFGDDTNGLSASLDELAIHKAYLSSQEIYDHTHLKDDIYYWQVNVTDRSLENSSGISNLQIGVCNPSPFWIIDSQVSCRNQSLSITNLSIQNGGNLTLENITLNIDGETIIESGGIFEIKNSKNTIWQNGNLTIRGTYTLDNSNLRMNSTINGTQFINVTDTGTMNLRNSSNVSSGELIRYYHFILDGLFNFSNSTIEHVGSAGYARTGGLFINNRGTITNTSFVDMYNGLLLHTGAKWTNISNISVDGVLDQTNVSILLNGTINASVEDIDIYDIAERSFAILLYNAGENYFDNINIDGVFSKEGNGLVHGVFLNNSDDNNFSNLNITDFSCLLLACPNPNVPGFGVGLNDSNNNIFTNSHLSQMSRGIQLNNSINNTFQNISIDNVSNYGFYLDDGSDNNSFLNISVTKSDGTGNWLENADNNTFKNLTIMAHGVPAINLRLKTTSVNNTFQNLKLKGTTATANLQFNSNSNDNVFRNFSAGDNTVSILRFTNVNNNTLIDGNLQNGSADHIFTATAGNNTFINVTFNESATSIASGTYIFVKWYIEAIAVDQSSNPIQNVNITIRNNSGAIEQSIITSATGRTPKINRTQWYETNNIVTIFDDYNINFSNETFYENYTTFNLSTNQFFNYTMLHFCQSSGNWEVSESLTCDGYDVNVDSLRVLNTTENTNLTFLNSNLTVGTGGIQIANNTTLNFFPSNANLWTRGNITVNGTLNLSGVTVRMNGTVDGGVGINITNGGIINISSSANISTGDTDASEFFFLVTQTGHFSMVDSYMRRVGYSPTINRFSGIVIRTVPHELHGNTFQRLGPKGILLESTATNSNIYNNTFKEITNGYAALTINVGSNHNVYNNTCSGAGTSSVCYEFNNITNSYANDTIATNVFLLSASGVNDSKFKNNSLSGIYSKGIILTDSRNLTLEDILIDGTVTLTTGLTLTNTNDSLFYNNTIINTLRGIEFQNSTNNEFRDIDLLNNSFSLYSESPLIQTTNTLLNVTYNISNISTHSSTSLLEKWYVEVYVNNTGGSDLENVNVTVDNSSGTLEYFELTGSNGLTEKKNLTRLNNSGNSTFTYFTNYTINASLGNYTTVSKSVNFSNNIQVNITLNSAPKFGSVELFSEVEDSDDGYINYNGGSTYSRDTTSNTMSIGNLTFDAVINRAYIDFNTSNISDQANISRILFSAKKGTSLTQNVSIYQMQVLPDNYSNDNTGNGKIFLDAADGSVYVTTSSFLDDAGLNVRAYINLSNSANNQLENYLQRDWFGIGIVATNESNRISNYNIYSSDHPTASNHPYVEVSFMMSNLTWQEDTNLTNYIDLYDFFYDDDNSTLNFGVINNTNISIAIHSNGTVNFTPDANWYGVEEVYFWASDGFSNITSNNVRLTVTDDYECTDEPLPDQDWLINATCTHENKVYNLYNNMTILNNGDLTLRNVTIIFNSITDGLLGTNVTTGGALRIYNRSNFTSNQSTSEYFFEVNTGSTFHLNGSIIQEAGWSDPSSGSNPDHEVGLLIKTNSAQIINTTFRNNFHDLTLWATNNTYVYNSTFTSNYGIVLYSSNLNANVTNVSYSSMGSGFFADDANNSYVSDSVFTHPIASGGTDFILYLSNSSNNTFLRNNFTSYDNAAAQLISSSLNNYFYDVNISTNTDAVLEISTNSNNTVINNSILNHSDTSDPVSVSNSTVTIIDTVIISSTAAGNEHIAATASAYVETVNVSINNSEVQVTGSGTIVNVKFYFQAIINDSIGPILNANVSIHNSSLNLETFRLTDGSGNIEKLNFTSFTKTPSTTTYFSNYTANASALSHIPNFTSFNLSDNYIFNKTLTRLAIIGDIDDNPDPQGYGRDVRINTTLTETDFVIDTVLLEVDPPGAETASNYTMTNSSPLNFTYNFTDYTNGTYTYRIWVNDSSGGIDNSSQGTFDMFVNFSLFLKTINSSYSKSGYVNLTDPPEKNSKNKNDDESEAAKKNNFKFPNYHSNTIAPDNLESLSLSQIERINGQSLENHRSSLDPPKKEKEVDPKIIFTEVTPGKVKPGDIMTVSAEVVSVKGITEVSAIMPYEKGSDLLNLELSKGNKFHGVWTSEWRVHDTIEKEYTTVITAKEDSNKFTTKSITWYDPQGYCFQEFANESTSCGGLNTGSYLCTGTWDGTNTCERVFDGDNNTYGTSTGTNIGYLNINYTKPSNSSILSYWQVKDRSSTITNVSINSLCWDQNPLQLRALSNYTGSPTIVTNWKCYDGSDWVELRALSVAGNSPYEEAMWWYLVNSTVNYTEFVNGSTTTDLSSLGADDVSLSLTVHDNDNHAKIEWIDNVSINNTYDLNKAINLNRNNIYLNSTLYPNLNTSANITIFNKEFADLIIYKDGSVCSDCSVIFNNGVNLTFNTTSFSNFTWEEANQSKLTNNGSTNSTVYLLFKVEYYNGTTWVLDKIVNNVSVNANTSDLVKFDTHFNGRYDPFINSSFGSGTYRVVVQVTDNLSVQVTNYSGDILNITYNFTWNNNSRPTVTNAEITPVLPNTSSDFTLNVTCTDPENGSVTAIYEIYNNSNNITSLAGSFAASNNTATLQSNVITSSNTLKNENWEARVRCYDGEFYSPWVNSSLRTIQNTIPSVTYVNITPSSVTTTDTLNCTFRITDADQVDGTDTLHANYTWYNGSSSFSTGNLSGITSGNEYNVTLDSSNTLSGENWTCSINGWDEEDNSGFTNDSIIIGNTLPTVPVLEIPTNNNSSIQNKTVTFNWSNSSDPDGDNITYDINISSTTGCTPDLVTYNITVSEYVENTALCTVSDNNNTNLYNWTVRACDATGCSAWASFFNFSIEPLVQIVFSNANVDFGSMTITTSDNTTDDNPLPFVIVNQGNVIADLVNITANASFFTTQPLGTEYTQLKADNTSESGSFNWSESQTTFINLTSNNQSIVSDLDWNDSHDSVEIDLNVTIPEKEEPGNKSLSLIVWFEESP